MSRRDIWDNNKDSGVAKQRLSEDTTKYDKQYNKKYNLKINTDIKLKEKFIACIVLHAIGDTIGYKNGDWEFNYGNPKADYNFSSEIVFEFLALGGILEINLDKWIVSDDTVLHMATASGILASKNPYTNDKTEINAMLQSVCNKYVKSLSNMNKRAIGNWTLKILNKIKKDNLNWDNIKYAPLHNGGGSGAAMRTPCLGLLYNGEDNRNKLIKYAIETSRITHNSVLGYMGGLVSALFTAFAIEGIPIIVWPFKFVNMCNKGVIRKYIKETRDLEEYDRDIKTYLDPWNKYISYKFINKISPSINSLDIGPDTQDYKNQNEEIKENIKIISVDDIVNNYTIKFEKSYMNPAYRSQFYKDYFSIPSVKNNGCPGSIGSDSVIIAYDCLIDATYKDIISWEKLVIYSMLHYGDSDTTGCIAAAWYGAMYGFKGVPEKNMEYLEYKNELIDLGTKMYKLFVNHFED